MISTIENQYKPEQINQILNPIVRKWFLQGLRIFPTPALRCYGDS